MTASCQPQVGTSPMFSSHSHSFTSCFVANNCRPSFSVERNQSKFFLPFFAQLVGVELCAYSLFLDFIWLPPAASHFSSITSHVPPVCHVCHLAREFVCVGFVFKAFYLIKYPLKNRLPPLNHFSNMNSFLLIYRRQLTWGFTWTYSLGGQRARQWALREVVLGCAVMMLCALNKSQPTLPRIHHS